MSILPPEFQFSQASLQDYVECKRRFLLRYIYRLAWPAVEAEPVAEYEAHVAAGEAFHRLIHQHQLGLPVEPLTALAGGIDDEAAAAGNERRLLAWWQNYLEAGPADLPPARYPEITLSAPAGDYRIVAKYDLIAVQPGRAAVIVDWKTGERRPKRAWLSARLQTRVYRYILTAAGAHLNDGRPLPPDRIAMLYWFADHPGQPERLPYSEEQYRADGRYLLGLIAEIAAAGATGAALEDEFPMTDDERRCRFCPYRSLCGRGIEAGDMAEPTLEEADLEPERDWPDRIDFEQVGEIAF